MDLIDFLAVGAGVVFVVYMLVDIFDDWFNK